MTKNSSFVMTFCLAVKPTGIKLWVVDDKITQIEYLANCPSSSKNPDNPMVTKISQEFTNYFNDPQYKINLPFSIHSISGTAFQKKVWQIMQKIPVGKTKTYSDVAKIINSSARAVGGACGANPLPILIPCHRIVGKNSIGGFAHQRDGAMITIKSWLLKHEGVNTQDV